MIMQADAQTPIQRRRYVRRALWVGLLLAVVAVALALLASWHFMLPDDPTRNARSSPKAVPGSLTDRDVSAISYLCRQPTIDYALARLGSGEFRWLWPVS